MNSVSSRVPPAAVDTAPAGRTIVQVVQAIDRGGLEMMSVDLAVALRERGLRSVLVALDEGGRLEQRLAHGGVEFHLLGGAHVASPRTHVALLQLFRRLRPAAVHTHHMAPLLNVAVAATAARVPRLVHTEHAYQYLEPSARLRTALRVASLATSAFVVVGAEQAAYYEQQVGVDAKRIRVIVNGVDTERFRPIPNVAARRAALGLPSGVLVGAVGRLAAVKNFALLLDALSIVRGRGLDVRVALVGDGEERAALEERAASLGITDAVHFLGWRRDVADLLPCFDVCALSSWSEGLPLVVLESMAASVPVVSTAVGDVPRVLEHGRAGLVVPIGDTTAFAAQLARLAGDPAERQRIGERARERVLAAYSQRAMVDAYLDAYGMREDRAVA
jgi:sugar transferase (PEP-CTERM/EpsH1 system associated)